MLQILQDPGSISHQSTSWNSLWMSPDHRDFPNIVHWVSAGDYSIPGWLLSHVCPQSIPQTGMGQGWIICALCWSHKPSPKCGPAVKCSFGADFWSPGDRQRGFSFACSGVGCKTKPTSSWNIKNPGQDQSFQQTQMIYVSLRSWLNAFMCKIVPYVFIPCT